MKSILFKVILFGLVFVIPSCSKERRFDNVFNAYKKNLSYLDEPHPRLMILFSGTPGMGKTVVAKRLEERFHAVRLSTDDIRPLLVEQGLKKDLANSYLEKCAHKLSQTVPNHLFVFDKSIDRTFDIYAKFARDHHYKIFLIQMRVKRSIVEERILSRGKDAKNILSQLDFAWKNYEDFGRTHAVDFVFENDENIEKSLEQLIEKVDAIFARKGIH